MAKDKDVIIKELEGIRDERRTHANTAQRIGNAMLSLLGCVENVGGNFLRKDKEDTAQKLIRFMEGLKLGDGGMGLDAKGGAVLSDVVVDRVHDAKSTPAERVAVGAQGFDLYMGDDGKSHLYVDYLVARTKFFASSAEVRRVSYSGGTTIFSNAGSTIAKVTYVFDAAGERVIAYKCYALADDGTTRTMNWWHVGMMALCQTFNVKAVETEGLQNRYYWRMVIGVGQETLEDSKLYDYVILSNVREFAGGEAMLPNKGVRVLADETGRVLRWGGVAVATVYDGELVSMAELFELQEGSGTDDGGNVIAQREFYGYEAVSGGEPDAPAEGDVIVQVGDQIRWQSRGNLIKLSTSTEDNASETAPAIMMYHKMGALWDTGAKDSAGEPVRNPYQWKEVTCVISPGRVLLNARMFKLFTDSVDNIVEPYVVMYSVVPSCQCIVRHTATRSTTPEAIEAETVKRVGNTTGLVSNSDVKYTAEVVWQDGSVETLGLADVHTRGLYNVKSLKIKAYMLKDAKLLAECDIAVVTDGEQGEDGKPGTDGKPGADGADGWDGKDAAVVVINPSVLTVDTVKDGSGNPRVDCSGEKVKADVRIEREGVSIVNECDGYEVVDMMGCSAHIADGGTSRMRIVVDSIVRDEYMVGSTKRYIPRTTATATVRIHCSTNNSYYYATLTVNVNVSAVWSELTITSESLSSKYSEISSSVEGMKGELKQYDSKIEQTARNIALKVAQTAVGRKNLLVGSDFRKQSDKWAGNDSYRPYISVLDQYGGCNSVVLENGANTYHGLDFFRVPVKTGKYTAGIMAKFNGKPESGSFAIYVARKDADGKQIGNNSWIPVDISNVVVGQWSLYSTSFDIEDKCKLIDLCFIYTNNPTAWFAQPMLVEGDEYVGWSLSKDDADYIGGNLLDNTDTLVQGGNLVAASGNLFTDANSYKGFPTRQVNLLESTGAFMGILEWDLSNDGVLTVGQDYMLSFWAKGNIGGKFIVYLCKDGNQVVYTEVLDRVDGPNQHQAADGNAGVIFKEDYAWRKYWVHWRVVGSNLPKYVQIRCMKGCDLYISQPKLEYGATVTEYRATKTDYIEDKSVAGKLLDTGIDLVHRKITMTADTAEFRANNGKTMAVFTADGLNTSLVKAERLETKGEEAVVKIADGMISVYGRANAPNIRFGVNAEGYAVMEYYDNAGNLLYDLGPAGMSTIKTQAAAISAQQFYPVTNTALTSPYTYELQCKSSMGSYDLKYLCAKGSNNDRLLFGREGFGQSGVLVSSNLGVSSNKAVFLHLYSAPRVNGQVVADKNADRGLTTQALAKAADGCYFTSDKNLAVNGRLNNVAIGEFIPFDVKTQSNMQDRILMLHENETISLPRLYFGGWLKQSLSSTTKLVKPDTVRLQVYGGGMFTQRGTWDGTMALEL